MLRIDEEWDSGNNLISEDEEDPDEDELYNELLKEIKTDYKLVH